MVLHNLGQLFLWRSELSVAGHQASLTFAYHAIKRSTPCSEDHSEDHWRWGDSQLSYRLAQNVYLVWRTFHELYIYFTWVLALEPSKQTKIWWIFWALVSSMSNLLEDQNYLMIKRKEKGMYFPGFVYVPCEDQGKQQNFELQLNGLNYCHFNGSLYFSGSSVKNLPCNAGAAGDMGSIPGLGRSPGGGHGIPLQSSSLENPMDSGAWQPTVHGVEKSWTQLRRLSLHAYKSIRKRKIYSNIESENEVAHSYPTDSIYIEYIYSIELRKIYWEWLGQDRHFVEKENNFLMEE